MKISEKKRILMILMTLIFLVPAFSDLFSKKSASENPILKAQTDIFFTRSENCYTLFLSDVTPASISMAIPDLPPTVKFLSSKKEEIIDADLGRGTLISLWFDFSLSGETHLAPLMVKINGKTHYYDFQKVQIYENPALISPQPEILFASPSRLHKNSKNGIYTYKAKAGEKINFSLYLKNGIQILSLKYDLPKNSIFKELERSDFAQGKFQIQEFTGKSQKIASFQWQILKEGRYFLPDIKMQVLSYKGEKREISMPRDIEIEITGSDSDFSQRKTGVSGIFAQAFEYKDDENSLQSELAPSREKLKESADSEKRTLWERLSGKKKAIFAGGALYSIPEERAKYQNFAGGQKVTLKERAGDWCFIQCEDFSGWVKKEDLFEIK